MRRLVLCAALLCEAKPVIAEYGLKQMCKKPYAVYVSDAVCLVITGVGALSCASAISWWVGCEAPVANTVFLNLGIAGGSEALGSLAYANKVVDAVSGQAFYPHSAAVRWSSKSLLTTLPRPGDPAVHAGLIDMEAAGFFAALHRFVSIEQVHCVKVVSDQNTETQQAITAAQVTAWMQAALPDLLAIIAQLQSVQTNADPLSLSLESLATTVMQRWHFTAYQQQSLRRLLRRWLVHRSDDALQVCAACRSANDVLARLSAQLAETSYAW